MEGRDLIVSGKSFHSLGPLYMTDQRQSCELIAGMGKSLFFLKRRPVFLILFVGKLITQEGRQELTALKTNNQGCGVGVDKVLGVKGVGVGKKVSTPTPTPPKKSNPINIFFCKISQVLANRNNTAILYCMQKEEPNEL